MKSDINDYHLQNKILRTSLDLFNTLLSSTKKTRLLKNNWPCSRDNQQHKETLTEIMYAKTNVTTIIQYKHNMWWAGKKLKSLAVDHS